MGKTLSVATAEEKNEKVQGQDDEAANETEMNNYTSHEEKPKTVTKEDEGKKDAVYNENLKGPNISKKNLTSSIVVSFGELADSKSIADACRLPQPSHHKPKKANRGKEISSPERSFTDPTKDAPKKHIDLTIIGKQEQPKGITNIFCKQGEIPIATEQNETTSSCVQKRKRKSLYNNSGMKCNSNTKHSNSTPKAEESKIIKKCERKCHFLHTLTPEIAADLREFGKHEMKKFIFNSLFAKLEFILAAGIPATLPSSNKKREGEASFNNSVQNSSSDTKQGISVLEAKKTQTVKICEQNCDFLNTLTPAIATDLKLFGKLEMEKWTINSLFTKFELPLATLSATTGSLSTFSSSCFIQKTENKSCNNDTVHNFNPNTEQGNSVFETKDLKSVKTCEEKCRFFNTSTPEITNDFIEFGKHEMKKFTINSLLTKFELPLVTSSKASNKRSSSPTQLSSIQKLEKKFNSNDKQRNLLFENKPKPKETYEVKDDFLKTLTPAVITDLKQIGKREMEKFTINNLFTKFELPLGTVLAERASSGNSTPLSSIEKLEKKRTYNNLHKNFNWNEQINSTYENKKSKQMKPYEDKDDFLKKLIPAIVADLKQMERSDMEKLTINSELKKYELPTATRLRASSSDFAPPSIKKTKENTYNNNANNFNPDDKSVLGTKVLKLVKTCKENCNFLSSLTPEIIADLKQMGKREMEKFTINSLLIKHELSLATGLATAASYCDSASSSSIKKMKRKILLPTPELKSLILTNPVNTFPTQSSSEFLKINKDIPSSAVSSVIPEGFQKESVSNECKVSQEVVANTGTKKKETFIAKNGEDLQKKVSSVRKQMSKVRSKLNETKKNIKTRDNTVAECQLACIENDQLAVWAMSMGTVRKPQSVLVIPPALDCQKSVLTDQNCTNNSVKIPSMEFFQSSNTNKQKTREQLETEVAALKNLVYQLALNNQINNTPQALLPTPHSIAPLSTQSIFSQNAKTSISANALPRPSTRGNLAGNENSEVHRKRRNRGKKKKTKNYFDKEVSMNSRKLCKYINAIMKDYLKGQENLNSTEYEYKENEDLEEYAQKCVRGDLGRIVEAEIRINRKNNFQSFVTVSKLDISQRDGAILKPIARNFAFDGDIVRAFVLNESHASSPEPHNKGENRESADILTFGGAECKGDNIESIIVDKDDDDSLVLDDLEMTTEVATLSECPKAFVIRIVEKIHNREVVGTIKFESSKVIDNEEYFIFKPYDMRIQLIYIPTKKCQLPDTEMANKNDISGFLYVAQVIKIQNGRYIGDLIHPLGECGDIKAEINAILIQNKISKIDPYGEQYNDLFSDPVDITTNDLKYREDLRKMCIFTIDPLTAKDLDDAVSCEELPNGNYEVGVHISDVSHYLTENSDLDNLVKHRAISIYLVNDVIHMLPRTLCLKCSLLPGEDKLAFSTFWIMNAEGEIQSQTPRFTRSVINSCAQFAYEHVQKIIEYPDEKCWNDDFPLICNEFTIAHIIKRVRILNEMAKKMRSRRYENGALSINNIKLWFILDPSGEPCAYNPEDRLEANFLIEEFMLLANQSTARLIYEKFPNISLLRNHSPPLPNGSRSLKEKLSKLGIEIDITTSKGIYKSLQKIISESDDPEAMEICLSQMLTKPMARAKYICSGTIINTKDLWHYALSIPIYTHFTSPIRRYADILVHRLLSAALGYTAIPQRTTEELQEIAKNCNEKKLFAKNIGDETALLFFKRYIKLKKSIILRAVITEIFRNSMQAITIETGHPIIISYRKQNAIVESTNVPAFVLVSEKGSTKPPIRLHVFSTIDVELSIIHDDIQALYLSPSKAKKKAKKTCN